MADLQKDAAKRFSEFWRGKGYERGQSQPFWMSLLRDVYNVEHPEEYIQFEDQVHLDNTSFIDGYIPATRVMIEQKSLGKNLNQPIKQSDGTSLTPFQQAKRYIVELPVDLHPRYVITCNFAEFWVYDMNNPKGEPEKILLENLDTEYYRLQFLVSSGNDHLKRELEVSIAAGEIVGLLYDAFARQYKDPTSHDTLHSLNVLCVRLVFCLYAENAGIFGHYGIFYDYLKSFDTRGTRKALVDLFKILDTKPEDRDPYLADDNPALAAFPYVNGGLFADENVEIPPFTDEIRALLLDKASAGFNWSEISPTIFGAVFESTLNPETRRSGGMHYTSIENIHKVIDPLFLDDLKAEFEAIRNNAVEKNRKRDLEEFQRELASLTFLDPACGSGNFLTESYLSLRRLENEVLRELSHGQISFADEESTPIMVDIGQFYGIEINDFAVTVAKTALWIAESQMLRETESIVAMHLDFLPLKSYTNIVEGNALRMNWEEVIPKDRLSYIMGNPPFVGYTFQTISQKSDLQDICKSIPEVGKNVDYVCGWYFKSAQTMQGTAIRTALVSTNSITQGEQVAEIWKPLVNSFGIHIDFAYRTFRWDSEANIKAHVHCIIVGFSVSPSAKARQLFDHDRMTLVENINPYLLDAPTVFIERRGTPVCDVPEIFRGCQPTDDGNLILSEDERNELISVEPMAEKYIRPFMAGKDYINRTPRFCLWLVGANPSDLRKCPKILERVERVREFRMKSSKAATRNKANTPTLFDEIHESKVDYIAIPETSSENRKYIPIGFLTPDILCSNTLRLMPNATLYHFGVLTSNVHMAWMRAVCGRLKSDYRYSINIVYNNFPWPNPTEEQRKAIEETAQAILDARELYPDSSLADLYDEVTMPPELRKAHQRNDRAVMGAYGFNVKETTETTCVAALMKLYQSLTVRPSAK